MFPNCMPLTDVNLGRVLQGAAEAHIVSYVAEGDATDWGCDVVWGDDYTDEEATRQLENCVAVFGIMFRLSDAPNVTTDDFFFEVDETANVYVDEDDVRYWTHFVHL